MKKLRIFLILFLLFSSLCASAQKDTTSKQFIQSWQVDRFMNIETEPIDSLWYRMHDFDPSFGQIYLSSYASAMQHTLYSKRNTDQFIFKNHYLDYFFNNENAQYYRTTTPYTYINYNSGGGSDKIAEVKGFHTQNVNKYLNVGFKIKLNSSSRFYEQNDQKTVKSSFLSLFGSYQSDTYESYFNINSNTVRTVDIGGIQSRTEFEEGIQQILQRKLTDANSVLKNRSINLSQKFSFGEKLFNIVEKSEESNLDKSATDSVTVSSDSLSLPPSDSLKSLSVVNLPFDVSILHNLSYSTNNYKYTDRNPGSEFYSSYPIYIDSNSTNDNAENSVLENDVFLSFQSKKFTANAGLSHEWIKYTNLENFEPEDTLKTGRETTENLYHNTKINGSLGLNTDNIKLNGEMGYYFLGYKQDDSYANLNISFFSDTSRIALGGYFKREEPYFYYQNYSSNHFQWDNNLDKTSTLKGVVKYTNEKYNLQIRIQPELIKNHVYLDTSAQPKQLNSFLKVATISLSNNLEFWKFHLNSNLNYQYSSNNDIVNFPEWYVEESLSFRHTFNFQLTGGKLDTQLGLNMYYFPKFYADGYMPALNLYHNQRNQKIGGNIILNIFANVKVKRTSAFVKIFHINSPLQSRNYYAAPDYPMSPLMLEFGVFWSFYD